MVMDIVFNNYRVVTVPSRATALYYFTVAPASTGIRNGTLLYWKV